MSVKFKINYTGSSKLLQRICERLNGVPTLGTGHDDAYYGDQGEEAWRHSLLTYGNPHCVNLEDLGIANLPNQLRMILDTIGALDSWIDHDQTEDICFITDHEGDQLVFISESNLLVWH